MVEDSKETRTVGKTAPLPGEDFESQRTSPGMKFLYFLLGFMLGPIGLIVAILIGRGRHAQEYWFEAMALSIIGWATEVAWFILLAFCGVNASFYTTFNMSHHGWTVFFFVIALLFIILNSFWVYGLNWKMTPQEKATPLHGDDWIKPDEKHLRYDAGCTLDCSADYIWPYIRQCGQTKAGWYSFDWLERLCTFDIHNHYTIHPEWQSMEPGDFQWFHQAPLTIGEFITEVDHREHYFAAHSDTRTDKEGPNHEKAFNLPFTKYFAWTWNWQVYDIAENRCRFIWRCDCTFSPYNRAIKYFVVFILGTASVTMGRGFMRMFKKIANGTLKIKPKFV